jgi:hypothetical protein
MPAELRLAIDADRLYPADAAFVAITDLFETRMLGYTVLQLDTVTTMAVGLLGSRSAIRHEAGTGPEVLEVYRRAGMRVSEHILSYRTRPQAEALADELIAAGRRIVWPYPPPAGRFPEAAHLVSPATYRYLNAKENMSAIVPAEHLPERRTLTHDQLAEFQPTGPVILKASGDAATGWGFAVHFCHDQASFDAARRWFSSHRDSVPAVIVEQYVEVSHCWCAGIAVGRAGTACFGGAEQLFVAPGKQSGTLIDPEATFPPAGMALAEIIGEAARQRGFEGIAGLDIGLTADGKLVVFDPNFRINSSTSQLLFHQGAATRVGLPVSRSFQVFVGGPFKDVAARLAAPIEEGWFVPTRIFNGEKHPLADGKHIVTGFALGSTRAAAEAAAALLEERLGR